MGLPKVKVAEGLFISMDPFTELDGEPLGPNFYKVFVQTARKPKALLERPRHAIETVGESIDQYVAWKSIDVNYNFFFCFFYGFINDIILHICCLYQSCW